MNNGPASIKPRRRWWWRILIGIFTLLVTTVIGRWVWWERTRAHGEEELAAAIAETEAVDPRWRWEQLDEDWPKVPDEQNSILVLKRFDESAKLWKLDSLKTADGAKVLPDKPDNRRLDDERAKIVNRELRDNEAIVTLAFSFKDFPRGRANIDFRAERNPLNTFLPHVGTCRKVAHVLELDIERYLISNRTAEAWIRVTAILNCAAGMKDEPVIISQLPRIALRIIAVRRMERILALGSVTAVDLERMQNRCQLEAAEDVLMPALRGDRAIFTIFFENLASGRLTVNELANGRHGSEEWDEFLGWTLYRARLPADQAFHLRTMNGYIAIAMLPTHEQLRKVDEFTSGFRHEAAQARADKERVFTSLMLPAIDKVFEAAIRDKALLRCTITALAAERYRLANEKKEWPKRLDDLCPKYLDAVPLDPFDGRPLKYKFRDDGVTIYSVGADGIDNGGTNLTSSGREPGADIGFRLWNPESRGLPPVQKDDEAKRP
jgi:hypothetical protein